MSIGITPADSTGTNAVSPLAAAAQKLAEARAEATAGINDGDETTGPSKAGKIGAGQAPGIASIVAGLGGNVNKIA